VRWGWGAMGEMEWALVVSGRRTNGGRGRTYAAASRGLGRHLDPDRREVVSAKLREAVEGEPNPSKSTREQEVSAGAGLRRGERATPQPAPGSACLGPFPSDLAIDWGGGPPDIAVS
jgi:hypothetical protein